MSMQGVGKDKSLHLLRLVTVLESEFDLCNLLLTLVALLNCLANYYQTRAKKTLQNNHNNKKLSKANSVEELYHTNLKLFNALWKLTRGRHF